MTVPNVYQIKIDIFFQIIMEIDAFVNMDTLIFQINLNDNYVILFAKVV